MDGIRVFISYSHDSRSHRIRVEGLADALEKAGFSVFLDEWVENPPSQWPVFIEEEFRRADVVICVCTPTYCGRVDQEVPGGQGKGATQEGSMVRTEGYELTMRADRFRVVHIEGSDVEVPIALGGKGAHCFEWPSDQARLLEVLNKPTMRRQLVNTLEHLFGEDIDALNGWAGDLVDLSTDKVHDFDDRARRIAYKILTLDDPDAKKRAFVALVEILSDEERKPIDAVAKTLKLGTLPRGKAPRPKRRPPGPPEPKPIPPEELALYLAKANALHQDLQLIGFEAAVRVAIELDDLYVPLDAMIDRGGRGRDVYAGAELAEKAKEADKHSEGAAHFQRDEIPLAEAFTRAREMNKRGVIVLGDPGSGKTTHLKQVLLKIVKDGPASIGLPPGTVPVFLALRNLRGCKGDLPGFIQQELSDPMLGMEPDFGERLCKRGSLLLLLDGLDEVADAGERAEVARWIERSRQAGHDSHILVSCRYAGYSRDVALDAHFLELHLRPLDDDQMKTFVTNWYAIVEKALLRDPQQAKVAAKRRTDDLLKTLSHTDFTAVARVYAMTRNPLLLTTICMVHRYRGRLPRARVELYEESIAVLLERWRKRLPETLLSRDQALRVLQPVAHWMHGKSGRTRASAAELRAPVQQGLSTLRDVSVSADELLKAIRDESGLLTGWGVDEYGFMHLGFQEFLTAGRLRNEGLKKPTELWALAQHFGDSWWQEVILLVLALDDPSVFEELMRAVVQQPKFGEWASSETMVLALDEAAEVSATPFVELLTSGGDRGDRKSLAARQLAAAQLLARWKPEEFEGLEGVLREHPTEAVRAWWWERQGRSEGEVIEAPRGGVELVRIPGGTFLMGGTVHGDEQPQHEVELASFYLAKTPVTNAQYRDYLKANPKVSKPEYWGNRQYNQDERPVVGVSWDEARAYCEWAGLLLPTEAQWEYACRAGTTTRYWSGDREEELARVGWYRDNSNSRLHAVAEKEPNAFGLYDMHGNVWEWCLDNFGSYATSARASDGLRHQPVGVSYRVVRGGGFGYGAGSARSAFRVRWPPGMRFDGLGFRPVQGHP